ncbi:hypothetical protein [Klebsiella grimontii]|uniref:hypothetical protein n=1 Tax=Klebsiella grimontii TaxID=2058152 RepID=UPI0012B811BF|nr:hypothetical protein [Klebsiella grimontii]
MSNFNGFTGNNDPVYYSRQTENADGTLTNEDTRQAGNSPVIPDGYVMVPAKLTAENGAKSALLGEFNIEYTLTCHECFGEGCEDCNDEGRWINSIPVDWTTIKAIWSKAVEHFVATQQEEKSE